MGLGINGFEWLICHKSDLFTKHCLNFETQSLTTSGGTQICQRLVGVNWFQSCFGIQDCGRDL